MPPCLGATGAVVEGVAVPEGLPVLFGVGGGCGGALGMERDEARVADMTVTEKMKMASGGTQRWQRW